MNELEKLYNVLVREGKTTKTFQEFQQQYAQDNAYRDKVYEVAFRDGLTNKDIEILQILDSYNRPLSRDALLSMARVDRSEYATIIEPTLLNRRLIQIFPKGRKITDYGRQYLRSIYNVESSE